MSTEINLSRRHFLLVSSMAGGALLVGCRPRPEEEAKAPPAAKPAATPAGFAPNAWVKVAPDGAVTIVCPRNEMGQDVYNSLAMLVAEELAVDPRHAKVEHSPLDPVAYKNKLLGAQITGGSTSVRDAWEPLRMAGAGARIMLVNAAAEQWKVPASECRAENGVVMHGDKKLPYGELAAAAAKQPVPKDVPLKPVDQFTVIGKDLPRLDGPDKTRGRLAFGIDVTQPGMLYAALTQCPVLGGKVASLDSSAAEQRPGVRKVVNIGEGVAVVADHFWTAKSALADLKIQWDEGPAAKLDTAAIYATLAGARNSKHAVIKHVGDPDSVLAKARPIEAAYQMQMVAHATLEPQNCVARVGPEGVDVWTSTQFPEAAHDIAAKMAGAKPDQVRIHCQFIGGGFGRRLDVDYVSQVVAIAKAVPGTPVKLIWTREEDMTHDYYRPPSVHYLRAALDANRLQAFTHTMISPSITQRMFPPFVKDGIDDFMIEGVKDLTYDIPNLDMRTIIQEIGLRVGYWRAVSNNNNGWAIESFMDELAHAARQDPIAFRMALLEKQPRQRAVLERVVQESGYNPAPPNGRAFGVASMACYDTHIAVVADVSGSADKVKLEKLTVVADPGVAVHPDQAIAQLEGGAVTGLINAIRGKITVKNGRIEQTNFHDFQIPRINEVPPIAVTLIGSGDKPGGMGETGVPLIAPAISNAIFKLTGKRIRTLPLEDAGVKFV
jgi:isoquinoline 1-oxidoreductase beta subunit